MSDVAIVGAGPAGAWAAYALARAGARVAIFDASHPREKPCGGGVTGRALALVATRSIRRRFARTRHSIRALHRIAAAGTPLGDARRVACRRSARRRALVVASRAVFDARAARRRERAPAPRIVRRASPTSRSTRGGVTPEHGATAPVTARRSSIGADGANSLVRRRLATAFRRDQLSIATGYLRARRHQRRDRHRAHGRSARLHLVVSAADHLAIGICAQADAGITAEALRAQSGAPGLRATRDRGRRAARAVLVADSVAERARLRRARARRTALGARRRRRRARRSDHARRDLLRAAVRPMDRRCADAATARRPTYAPRVRDERSPNCAARRGSRPDSSGRPSPAC